LSVTRLLLAALAAGALLGAVLWWRAAPEQPPATAAPQRTEPARAAYDTGPLPATRPASGPPAAPLDAALLRAAVVARLPASLSHELVARLAAGDVAEVARALAAGRGPGSAAALAELALWCQELAEPHTEADAQAARSALGAAAREPAAGAALEALIGARRAAERRLAAGCAGARFDAAAIDRQLQASARNGDAASLERLALTGSGGPGKLTSAALLGAPRAQLRLGLDSLRSHPVEARSWLEAAAKQDADAQALLGTCLLAGCGADPDPVAGRATLESAARRGAPFALGLLSSGAAADEVHRWLPAGALVAPLPPPDPDALALSAADRLAWAALAGRLAEQGCFGFELSLAAEALAARPHLERSLSPADVAAGARAADELEAASGAAVRHARGCD